MKYLVTERYYDTGKVSAVAETWDGKPFVEHESAPRFDVYRSVHPSVAAANRAIKAAQAA